MFASVLINSNARQLNRVFDYKVPKEFSSQISIGCRVFVPFGKGTNLSEGYVIDLKKESEYECREIAVIEDSILTKENIELAKLMAQKYFCNVSDCIKLMLPPGSATRDMSKRMREKKARFVYLDREKEEIRFEVENVLKSEKHQKLLSYLINNDGIDISELEILTGVSKAVMKTLEKNGYIKFTYTYNE